MPYQLNSPDRRTAVPISEAEFNRYRTARTKLLAALALEEKFDILLENFAELEKTLLDLSLRSALFRHGDGSSRHYGEFRRLGNRRIANFLSTARLYRDQSNCELKRSFGRKKGIVEQIETAVREIIRNAPHYSAIEELRNHVQHRDLPVKNIRMSAKVDLRFSPPRRQVMIRVLVDYSELVRESKKPQAYAALGSRLENDKFADVMPSIREYVVCVGKLQELTRKLLAQELADAERDVQEAYAKLPTIGERKPAGLYVVEVDDQGAPDCLEWISRDYADRRRELMAKNRSFDGVAGIYVASMDVVGAKPLTAD